MKTKIETLAMLGALLCAAACATPAPNPADAGKTVTVTFSDPEKFTDVKRSDTVFDKDRDDLLSQIKEHLVESAPKRMAAGQSLAITITDVDMAGDFEPWRGPAMHDIRIIRDIHPPRIVLSFKLADASGALVAEGTRRLLDLSFMMRLSPVSGDDTLRYEKALLDDWLAAEFAAPGKGR